MKVLGQEVESLREKVIEQENSISEQKSTIFNIQKNAVDAKAKNQDSFFKDIIIVEYKIVEPQTVLGFDSDDIFVSKHEAVSISYNVSSTGD